MKNRIFQNPSKKYVLLLVLLLMPLGHHLMARELTNYRTGIDLVLGGETGSDYVVESLYYDGLVSDRKVVYLRSTTPITLRHNERNIARVSGLTYEPIGVDGPDKIANTGDEGVIRYKVDGDLSWGGMWTQGRGGSANPAFKEPLTFGNLSYPDGKRVLGSIGGNRPNLSPKEGYFHYGHLDSIGDEWHTIEVADDDSNGPIPDSEWMASDGRIHIFVVDPKTPVLTVNVSGDAQYYTTPPKTHFIPKIHKQTTYIDPRAGSISVELQSLDGANVLYRINGGAVVDSNSSRVQLSHRDFKIGENQIEYYCKGREGFVRTRRVVREPGFPSRNETHGLLVIGNDANLAAAKMRSRLQPYQWHWDRLVSGEGDTGLRIEWESVRRKGLRYVPKQAFANAVVAKFKGIDVKPPGRGMTYAQYAKEMILENARTIDNVGFEMHHSGTPLPSRELTLRGYYDVNTTLDLAYAYDLLISIYRSDMHPDGITPIEDLYLRDCIADNVVECLMFSACIQSPFEALDSGGMWDVSRKCGALIGMFAMPSYSTSYYGTSGMDGNTTVFPGTPFMDEPLTWKKVFLDDNAPLKGYPNLANRLGIEQYICLPDGHFADRVYYAANVGNVLYHVANILKYHQPSKQLPNMEAFFKRATEGSLIGKKDGSGPARYIFLPMFNPFFPEISKIGIPFVMGFKAEDEFSDTKQINGHMPLALFWYRPEPAVPSAVKNLRIVSP